MIPKPKTPQPVAKPVASEPAKLNTGPARKGMSLNALPDNKRSSSASSSDFEPIPGLGLDICNRETLNTNHDKVLLPEGTQVKLTPGTEKMGDLEGVVLPVSRIAPIIVSGSEPNMGDNWIWKHPQWPSFQWDLGALAEPLGAARRAQGRLEILSGLLGQSLTREALAEVMKVEGIATSAIEGERLNPASVAASVARHLGLPWDQNTPLDRNADGLVSVMHDAVQSHQGPLTIGKLCEWQSGLFPAGWSGLSRVTAGELRPGEVIVASGPIGREIVHFEGVSREHLESELKTFVDWFNESQGQMDGLIRAGTAHLWFVTLHPFEDGNGRITRALTDMAIAQDGSRSDGLFRMSSRILAVRNDYYDALQRAQGSDSGMDATPWLKWFLTQVSEACKESEGIIQQTLAKAKFWAVHCNTELNERQRKVLNRMLDAGPGGFEGGMNARKYGSLTHSSKPTASRDLAELLEHGCIVHVGGGGRSTAYDIPWTDFLNPSPTSR